MRPLDLAYLAAATVTAPYWLWRLGRTGRLRTDWRGRMGHADPWPRTGRPRLLLHAVSVGEVNAIRQLVARLAAAPERPEIVIATTTDTGFARASEIYREHRVVRYPLDLSWSVRRFFDAIRPDAVALVELEVWPAFTAECETRGIPVCVINGRLSERSFGRYARVLRLVRPSFRRLATVAAQDEAYAERFRAMGVAPHDVVVTGTMKWDTATPLDDATMRAAEKLRDAMGIDPARPLVVAGSTAPGEHELLHAAVPDGTQLLCAPRRPDNFEAAATSLPGCARRSRGDRGSATDRFLLDTIGELRAAYALADVVVVGRTFVPLGGSDMIESIALGRATIVGPHTRNFADTMKALAANNAIVVTDADGLSAALRSLLDDSVRRARLAEDGAATIRANQGATDRNAELLLSLLPQATVGVAPKAIVGDVPTATERVRG